LPGIEYQSVGATLCRNFLPAIPAASIPAGTDLLVQRTNLLSPSVALQPVFKVTQITATMLMIAPWRISVNELFEEKIIHRISVANIRRSGEKNIRQSFRYGKL
jgi:hypothetical protein